MTEFKALRAHLMQKISLHVLELNPERVQPAISVQPHWDRSHGIIRGIQESGQLVEDHIAEELDDHGHLIEAGRRIVGADDIRRQVWTAQQHLDDFAARYPSDEVIGWVGNGNLLSNPYFVAGVGGRLWHLAAEEQQFTRRTYSCLAIWRAGQPRRVSIESLDLSKTSLPDGLESFTVGQSLVKAGQPIDTDELVELAKERQFYDLRHLFLFGRIPYGEKRWMDLGLTAFWKNGEMDTNALERAIRGQATSVDVSQFGRDAVRDAMRGKDYVEVAAPEMPGQYSLDGNTMNVCLLEGLYPHNMIGIRQDGTLISVVAGGLSNRAGLTLRGAARLMASLGAVDALLIDNGGDVTMTFDGELVLPSAEGERSRFRSILLFRHPSETPLPPTGARLVAYPGQTCASLLR